MKNVLDTQDMKTTYVETLTKLMEENGQVCSLGADLMGSSGTTAVQKIFPQRVINVGIAEANMIGIAAGMSACGKIPFADTFAAFASRRCYDQICVSVGYAKQNVKVVAVDPGVASEHNGGTHMAIEDVSMMRGMANMMIFEPCDNEQIRQGVPALAATYGPAYMRLFRRMPRKIYDETYQLQLGKADELAPGTQATIIACGCIMVESALDARDLLAEEGIDVAVVNMHTIKPIDVDAVVKAAKETGAIVTAENCNTVGGLGSAVAEVMCQYDVAVPLEKIGIQDHFGEVGTRDYLLEKFHMTAQDVADAVKAVIARKK